MRTSGIGPDPLSARKPATAIKIRNIPAITAMIERDACPQAPTKKPMIITTRKGSRSSIEFAAASSAEAVGKEGTPTFSLSFAPMRSVAETKSALESVGYLADEPAALVSYLAQELGKPVLVEGPTGVGKTELEGDLARNRP